MSALRKILAKSGSPKTSFDQALGLALGSLRVLLLTARFKLGVCFQLREENQEWSARDAMSALRKILATRGSPKTSFGQALGLALGPLRVLLLKPRFKLGVCFQLREENQ